MLFRLRHANNIFIVSGRYLECGLSAANSEFDRLHVRTTLFAARLSLEMRWLIIGEWRFVLCQTTMVFHTICFTWTMLTLVVHCWISSDYRSSVPYFIPTEIPQPTSCYTGHPQKIIPKTTGHQPYPNGLQNYGTSSKAENICLSSFPQCYSHRPAWHLLVLSDTGRFDFPNLKPAAAEVRESPRAIYLYMTNFFNRISHVRFMVKLKPHEASGLLS